MNLSSYLRLIQILLCQDIALCVSNSTFWKHHVTVDQISEKALSTINNTEGRKYNLKSDSEETYIPIAIDPSRLKLKLMKEQPDVRTDEILDSPDQSTEFMNSESNSDSEDSYNTEEIQTTFTTTKNNYEQYLRAVPDRKLKHSSSKELTTALVSGAIPFKATTTHRTLVHRNKMKKVKITKHSSPRYTNRSIGRVFGTTLKNDLNRNGERSHFRSSHVHNVNDVLFHGHKITKGRNLLSVLRSQHKKEKNLKLLKSSNRTLIKKKQQLDSVANLEYLHPHVISKQLDCLSKKWGSRMRINQEVIGKTFQYNDIVMWKLKEICTSRFKRATDDKFVEEEPEKKIILIVHGLSVMGWSKRTCFRDIDAFETLLSYYVDNLDAFDIFLIPMANPDGVMKVNEMSMWNKNMAPQSACPGANVDRNFDVAWNDSLNVTSCSQMYPGPHPFSEQESTAVYKVLHKYSTKIIGYFHFHAGEYNANTLKGDAVLYPKGYTAVQDDDDRYVDLRSEIDEAMKNMSFRVISVTVDTLYDWYGKISGSSVDYASTSYGVPYCLELVLQLYNTYEQQDAALTEIWQNVLDVIFDHIARSQATVEDNEN